MRDEGPRKRVGMQPTYARKGVEALKIVVTGGAGFIGSNLVDALLAEGHNVLVIDNLSTGKFENLYNVKEAAKENRFSFFQMDIRDTSCMVAFKGQNPDVVMHLAAQADVRYSVRHPLEDAEINILGTINLLQFSVESGVKKFIHTSSGGCIYGEPDHLPVSEDTPRKAISPYGVSKNVTEEYLRYFMDEYGLRYTTLALANVYGPRQNPFGEAGVVAIFIGKMLAGNSPTIYGTGEQTRDFVYVEDVVESYKRAVNGGDGELINIGTSVETSVNQLFSHLAELCDFEGDPTYAPPRQGELERIALKIEKAETLLGWKPRTPLVEGLKRTVSWYQENLKR
jgi:UDP-glucose 4-epimerase